ncbi:MoaD/ThiS family protein [Streptomyces sp. S186]|uniref:MoaD/ThiS family protein n=1 Tax=Streptomyces sp. S186 TaxID=3434395 RepID=UPI003F66F540
MPGRVARRRRGARDLLGSAPPAHRHGVHQPRRHLFVRADRRGPSPSRPSARRSAAPRTGIRSCGRLGGTHRVLINGELVSPAEDHLPLQDGDTVEILTAIAGG